MFHDVKKQNFLKKDDLNLTSFVVRILCTHFRAIKALFQYQRMIYIDLSASLRSHCLSRLKMLYCITEGEGGYHWQIIVRTDNVYQQFL